VDPDADADGTRLRRRARLALFQTTGLPAADPSFFNTIAQYRTLGLRSTAPESCDSFSAIFPRSGHS
ncbi:hypothetical protein, partial [Sphingomonas sp. TWP1-3-1]|uniref:hypothetical protein n=1 Tax=Sphingomonas sp. TWP1-3-1 TaxID=2804612 RepID=UPI003CF58DF4